MPEEYRTSGGLMSYGDRGEGAGDPLVLLHAFPLHGKMWAPQVEELTDNGSSSRRVITPDYPGFGASPRPCAQPDVRYYAEGVLELLDRLGLQRVVLGGLSMGGYVAFAILRLAPERVSALVLANTRPDPDNEEARESRREMARSVAEEGVQVLEQQMMQRLLAPSTLENEGSVVRFVREIVLESSPDGAVAALGAMRDRPDSTDLLESIKVPTLVLGGAEDTISTPEVMARMAEVIPESRHETLEGAGHLSNLEAPKAFNAALTEFLTSR